MKRTIWKGPGFCAAEEDGLLTEYLQADPENQAGDILLGKVERMMPGLDCAFVDIGREKAGYLPMRENSQSFTGGPIRSGDRIPVQIRKEETGGKGAYLTRDLTLAGQYVLLMPVNRYFGVSGRIADETQKKELRETGRRIAGERTGLVMRSGAARAEERLLRDETERLLETWHNIAARISEASRPGEILYHDDPIRQMITDYEVLGTDCIRETETLPPELERQRRRSGERTVRLPNGGNIVIDRCEAMTVIDVNTGSACGTGTDVRMETNLSACETLAAQVRLRNLAGILLIDFIDMDREEDRERVAERLREVFSRDRRKTVLHGWTNLGLMEMTRKRTGKG
ncbi:MAG: ribonuclease E/G [Clostridia bacterium]|nr:ribonuclease E/G [Clostridia bacterium]